jgi:hypothetical protein
VKPSFTKIIRMSVEYRITGTLQAVLFTLLISAVYVQLRLVRKRRRMNGGQGATELPTENLSVVAIAGAFAAFLSFLLLSTATQPFAHYIFWSRIPSMHPCNPSAVGVLI